MQTIKNLTLLPYNNFTKIIQYFDFGNKKYPNFITKNL
jgi:hypothetical protein